MNNFFREDLKLNNKWWHRALKIIFFMSLIVATVSLVKWSIEYNKGYKEIYKLSQNIPDTPTKLKDIVNNLDKEKKFLVSTSKPHKDQNDSRFNVYKDITFCSLKIDEQFLDLLSQNGGIGKYELYSGPMFGRKLLSPTEFGPYLKSNNINCLTLDSYTGTDGELVPMISINYEVQNMSLYKYSVLETIKNIFDTVFNNFGIYVLFLIAIVFYYKVILYIVFGNKK